MVVVLVACQPTCARVRVPNESTMPFTRLRKSWQCQQQGLPVNFYLVVHLKAIALETRATLFVKASANSFAFFSPFQEEPMRLHRNTGIMRARYITTLSDMGIYIIQGILRTMTIYNIMTSIPFGGNLEQCRKQLVSLPFFPEVPPWVHNCPWPTNRETKSRPSSQPPNRKSLAKSFPTENLYPRDLPTDYGIEWEFSVE